MLQVIKAEDVRDGEPRWWCPDDAYAARTLEWIVTGNLHTEWRREADAFTLAIVDRPAPTPTPAPGLDLDAVERDVAHLDGPHSLFDDRTLGRVLAVCNAAPALIAEVRALRLECASLRRAWAADKDAVMAAGEERESRAWSEKGKAPPGSCPFCASRISMVQRDGYFIARCSHRGCGAVGPRMRSVSRAADLFCQPPRREAQGMSCGPIVASPPRPRCSCTHEAGDSRCDAHPTCSECGATTPRPVDGCEACRGPLPKGG